jgi:hypothetical protein
MTERELLEALLAVGERATDDIPCVFVSKAEGAWSIGVGEVSQRKTVHWAGNSTSLQEAIVLCITKLVESLEVRAKGDLEATKEVKRKIL